MKVLFDSHRQQYLRLCYQGLTLARLQANNGKNVLMKNADFEKLLVENDAYPLNTLHLTELTNLVINPN